MLISAVKITDPNKKNELILYVRTLNGKAIYSKKYQGIAIECYDSKAIKKIEKKIKDLVSEQEKEKRQK